MNDLSNLLIPRTYSAEALALVLDSFATQPDDQTCGAAAPRHGLLLGGLSAPVNLLEALLEIRDNGATDEQPILDCLRCLGFQAEPINKEPGQRTATFLDGLRLELAQGAFLLPCLDGWMHWVCLGAWDGKRAWLVDSFYGTDRYGNPRELCNRLDFYGFTEQEFDEQKWKGYVVLVRPGKWAKQYQDWLPARRALLRMPAEDGQASPMTVESAVAVAAQQYLSDAEYAYRQLRLYLPGGVEVSMAVEDPGEDAVLVDLEGVGAERTLAVHRAKGAARARTPPELVLRAGHLHAAQLGCSPDQ